MRCLVILLDVCQRIGGNYFSPQDRRIYLSTLKVEAVRTFESLYTYHIPERTNLQLMNCSVRDTLYSGEMLTRRVLITFAGLRAF
jgi:hypothetical protein